jgi:UDP-N-acetylglucosamine 2-epimerase (non-hydrolysing)
MLTMQNGWQGEILKGLRLVGEEFSLAVIFLVHSRTRKMAAEFGFEFDGIWASSPVGFLEFLQLESGARPALTDSGGGPGGGVHSRRALA